MNDPWQRLKPGLLLSAAILLAAFWLFAHSSQTSGPLYFPSPAQVVFGAPNEADNVSIQKTGASVATITGKPLFATGISPDGGGLKHLDTTAGCATAATAGATCDTTVTWTTAFADTAYTPVCVGGAVTSGVPASVGVTAIAAGNVTFRTVAITAAAAQFTTVRCWAVHD